MDRTKMIQVLSAISEGSINPADLAPGRGYFLKEESKGVFRDIHSGIAYTQDEIDAISKDIDRRDAIRRALLSDALTEPMIIILMPDKFIENTTVTIEVSSTPEVIEEPEVVKPVVEEKKVQPKKQNKQVQLVFNLAGEIKDLERANKMDEFTSMNEDI